LGINRHNASQEEKQKQTALRRLSVSFASKVGCLYFFEKRSFTIDLLPTKVDSKTL
jgi:hypothetical protein